MSLAFATRDSRQSLSVGEDREADNEVTILQALEFVETSTENKQSGGTTSYPYYSMLT